MISEIRKAELTKQFSEVTEESEFWQTIDHLIRAERIAEAKECAEIFTLSRSEMLLAFGEMTAQEMRTAIAILALAKHSVLARSDELEKEAADAAPPAPPALKS